MKVIIAAAGLGARWGGHMGIRKHQAPVNGVPIIQRQINQFNRAGHRPLVLCHPEYMYDYPGADYTTVWPDPKSSIDKIYSSRDLWATDEDTLVSFGDVYYSRPAMKKLLAPRGEWTVYGRIGKSKYSPKRNGLFALRIPPGDHKFIRGTCEQLADLDVEGRVPSGGRLHYWYQMVTGQDFNPRELENRGHFVVMHDETDDADSPNHYRVLCRAVDRANAERKARRSRNTSRR